MVSSLSFAKSNWSLHAYSLSVGILRLQLGRQRVGWAEATKPNACAGRYRLGFLASAQPTVNVWRDQSA